MAINVPFSDENGGHLQLEGPEDTILWIENELSFWSFLNDNNRYNPSISSTYPLLLKVLNKLQTYKQELLSSNTADTNAVQNLLDRFHNEGFFISRSRKAIFIKSILEIDGQAAATGAFFAAMESTSNLTTVKGIVGVTKYTMFMEGATAAGLKDSMQNFDQARLSILEKNENFKKISEESLASSRKIQEELTRRHRAIKRWSQSRWSAFKKEKSQELGVKVVEFDAVKRAYTEQMNIAAPVEYWKEKSSAHLQKSNKIRIRLILFSVISSVNMVLWPIAAWPEVTDDLKLYGPLSLALIFFVSTAILWAARIMVRLYLSEIHLSLDASERATIAQTYLALIKENQIEKADRDLLLSALFRPTKDGIIKDDGSPTLTPSSLLANRL